MKRSLILMAYDSLVILYGEGAAVILAMGDGRRAANNIHEYLPNSNR